MRITAVAGPPLFTGTATAPLQVVRVTVRPGRQSTPILVRVEGPGLTTPVPFTIQTPLPQGQREAVAEVGVRTGASHRPGAAVPVLAIAETAQERAERRAEITVTEPGWTMWMVSHFHYDPVWWDTQGEFTESRPPLPDRAGRLPDVRTAFDLVRLHLAAAKADPDYKFVLAELDYLKPYFATHPQDRADLRDLLARGQVEIVGGNYNEPNTNLTSAESTIRNAIYGIAHQRDVLGGDPTSAWMLDAFGHDPAYPGLMASAGLTSSAWARGPYHQWGPRRTVGSNARMQFPSEFEWLSPDGHGLLTSYLADHYSAGWVTHTAPDLPAAQAAALDEFLSLAPVAATRNVLLPVGADHVIPSRWVTAIHRDWNSRYTWPRFVTALPREFFAAVRAEAAERDIWITPQTRDMNPVYPGKDVTYIDTKQAHRAAEVAVEDGERLATLAWLAGAAYPARSLDKAWRLLVYAAHHDAITGTESDQVYLDLLAGWREAFDRGEAARREAAGYLGGLACTLPPGASRRQPASASPPQPAARAVLVVNTLSWPRAGQASITLAFPGTCWTWLAIVSADGAELPFLAEGVLRHGDGTLAEVTVTFRAQVPALGFATYWAVPATGDGGENRAAWQPLPATTIGNGAFEATADPALGGALTRLVDRASASDLLRGPGNELVLTDEHRTHPRWGEGAWLLSPRGTGTGSAGTRADVRAQRCPVGARLVATLRLRGLRVTQETILWDGSDRVEFRTHVDGSIGAHALLRVRFPVDVPGALPVYQSAAAVVGRPFGTPDADVATHPFTLDNPAHEWFGLAWTTAVMVDSVPHAIGVAEVIAPDERRAGPGRDRERAAIRSLVAALAAQGVTATCARPDGPRYGSLDLDSNLPDVRIVLGGPERSTWTARLLARSGHGPADEMARQRARHGTARVWLHAARPRAQTFAPSADVRGDRDLPVLLIAGDDLAGAIEALVIDLQDAVIEGVHAAPGAGAACDPPLAGHSAALLNRGTPSSVVSPDGTMHITVLRASGAWPSGVWIDGDRRTAPDGTSFSRQHWSHQFDYALVAGTGDWRDAGFMVAGQDYNHPLLSYEVGVHDGPLPARVSLAAVDAPAGDRPVAVLSALKPGGNPLARGLAGEPDRGAGVIARLRATGAHGTGTAPGTAPGNLLSTGPPLAPVRLFTPLAAAYLTDVLERPAPAATDSVALAPAATGEGEPLALAGETVALVPVGPAGVTTVALIPDDGEPLATSTPGTCQDSPEPAQPVFTRYWLHGKGPAPAGNLPVTVHLDPARLVLPPPDTATTAGAGAVQSATVKVSVAAGLRPAAGAVTLIVPDGLTVHHPSGGPAHLLPYDLSPDSYATWELTVCADGAATPGRRFLAARIEDEDGQSFEDATLITIAEPPLPPLDAPLDILAARHRADQRATAAELALTVEPARLRLAPGERGEFVVRITNQTAGSLRGEAQLISPFGMWEAAQTWTRAFAAPPGYTTTLRFPVRPLATARPGVHRWVLAKVSYFGRVRYSPAAGVEISG